jgi:hypothetical protein
MGDRDRTRHRTAWRGPVASLALLATATGLGTGVGGCGSPTEPAPPPADGGTYVLDFARFETSVAPVLADFGCRSLACHGGGIRGTFRLSPDSLPDVAFDFEQAIEQVDPWNPDESRILVKPLSRDAGGVPHNHEPFDSVDHAGYVAIREWILAGEFE